MKVKSIMKPTITSRLSKCKLTKVIASVLCGYVFVPHLASAVIKDSPEWQYKGIKSNFYYMYRDRDRKNIEIDQQSDNTVSHGYKPNLRHSTFNASLDFSSGLLLDMFGFDLGINYFLDIEDRGPAYPNEMGFSRAKTVWDEKWQGGKNAVGIYRATVKAVLPICSDDSCDLWLKAGYIQPSGQSLVGTNWSFLPGTYQGAEIGYVSTLSNNDTFSISYFFADKYKAPWYRNLADFRMRDGKTKVNYIHSLGFKYGMSLDEARNITFEGAFGQSKGYVDQYFAKVSYQFPIVDNPLNMSYQFYGARDKIKSDANLFTITNDPKKNPQNDLYDGLAKMHALTFDYKAGMFDIRLEGTAVQAKGELGFFLPRMTPTYGSSNGRLDIWWDSRSDFNAHGEKSVFIGVLYDLSDFNLKGWKVGTSYAYGWDAKPSTRYRSGNSTNLKESAWNFDIMYTAQSGPIEGATFKLHYTKYNNHSDIPSWGGGYNNIFQDEKDIKFSIVIPIFDFNANK